MSGAITLVMIVMMVVMMGGMVWGGAIALRSRRRGPAGRSSGDGEAHRDRQRGNG
jgi:hypothetical protein